MFKFITEFFIKISTYKKIKKYDNIKHMEGDFNMTNNLNISDNTLIVLMGFPASGKSTVVKQLVSSYAGEIKVFSFDDRWNEYVESVVAVEDENKERKRVLKEMRADIREYLKTGKPLIVDGTNLTKKIRKSYNSWLQQAKVDYTRILIHITTPFEECVQRNSLRSDRDKVPDSVMKFMKEKLYQEPSMDEGWTHYIKQG